MSVSEMVPTADAVFPGSVVLVVVGDVLEVDVGGGLWGQEWYLRITTIVSVNNTKTAAISLRRRRTGGRRWCLDDDIG